MIEEVTQTVAQALNALGIIEVVEVNFRSDQIGFTCRARSEGDAIKIIYQLLSQEEGWQSHLCKKYFLQDRQMRFGWNFSFRSDDIQQAGRRIAAILKLFKTQYLDTPAPLPGMGGGAYEVPMEGSGVRNDPGKGRGKGATAMGAG
jgi:hypothetical protein